MDTGNIRYTLNEHLGGNVSEVRSLGRIYDGIVFVGMCDNWSGSSRQDIAKFLFGKFPELKGITFGGRMFTREVMR